MKHLLTLALLLASLFAYSQTINQADGEIGGNVMIRVETRYPASLCT